MYVILWPYKHFLYYDLRKEESIIDLALKMAMKGMSEEAIVDVLGIEQLR